jgi:ketol-acid reductoisomerase
MANYFNTLNLRQQLAQLGKCRFMGATNSPMAQATFRVKKWSSSAVALRA